MNLNSSDEGHFGGGSSDEGAQFKMGLAESSPKASSAANMFNDVQQRYQEDMHGLIDDISMPNQSMTMSNLSAISQSPFRGAI